MTLLDASIPERGRPFAVQPTSTDGVTIGEQVFGAQAPRIVPAMSALHENRDRADSFGADAEAYDRTRPAYPDELVDRVAAGAADVLDVGCGTGKLGRQFAERGIATLGVEPDARMAALARRHGLAVEVSTFETWDDAGRRFDAVVAGQAWHWVDPVAGTRRAADVLRPGGRIALFWNVGRFDDDAMKEAVDAAYAEHFPENPGTGTQHAHHHDLPGIVGDDRFGPAERWSHPWTQDHSTAEWIDQLATHSNHRLLTDERRARLFAALTEVVDQVGGGTLRLQYDTVVLTAVRRAS